MRHQPPTKKPSAPPAETSSAVQLNATALLKLAEVMQVLCGTTAPDGFPMPAPAANSGAVEHEGHQFQLRGFGESFTASEVDGVGTGLLFLFVEEHDGSFLERENDGAILDQAIQKETVPLYCPLGCVCLNLFEEKIDRSNGEQPDFSDRAPDALPLSYCPIMEQAGLEPATISLQAK